MYRRSETDLMKNPVSTAKIIKNACELIAKNPKDKNINLCKTEEDIDIQKLNEKFCNKWLYFDNCEETSYIIYNQ